MKSNKQISFGKVSDADLRLLRIFATIVESGGFSEAQAELNTAPSTISTYMANLERRLGLRLCSRGRRGFQLTESGRVVYDELDKLFGALRDFESAVATMRGQLAGDVRVGIVDNSMLDPSTRIPNILLRFRDRYPQSHLTVEVMSPTQIEEAVLEGKVDIGVAVFHRRKPGLDYLTSFSETLDLYCGADHPLYDVAPEGLSPSDLAGVGFARGIHVPVLPQAAVEFLAEPSATAHQAEGLGFLILSGRFIGYLPRRYAEIWVERGQMRPLLPDKFSCDVTFSIFTRKGGERTPVIQAFLEEIGSNSQS
ncbi:LysR family transcriptional regulator [Ruegeria sp. SCP11]|uniref:LysR family transcriptional regulator n=1 Tax=Ruegeria sp. SCP11 TaxID=3141378 RepID=UPI00333B0A15